jgi:hypothetical protein
MSTIVCFHGLGLQEKGEDTLLSQWTPALRDGVRRAGGDPPDQDAVVMAFYGDIFRKKGTKSLGIPPYDETDVTEKLERELLQEWWLEAARVEEAVPGPDAETKLRTPRLVQRALYALSHSRFFASVALKLLIADLKQVQTYLLDDAVRAEVQDRVAEAVTEETRVIVAHSMGTIVAYEALCAHPEWPVRTLVTLGSPLGIRNLIFERLRPAPEGGIGAWPEGLTRWSNVADGGDIVALEKKLRPRFSDRVYDHLIHNGARAHDASPYLTAEETGHAIAQGLAS